MQSTDLHRRTSIVLVHHPVVDKNGGVITSAVTNLDIHDIARTARTFSLYRHFLVTPVREQMELVEKVVSHWLQGWGAAYNPSRSEALSLVETAPSIDDVIGRITDRFGIPPVVVATGASHGRSGVSAARLRECVGDAPLLILFGTGWGLHHDVIERADHCLEPIRGNDRYNHLPVRSAVAIYLDRLFGLT